jgi:hypothetical protein
VLIKLACDHGYVFALIFIPILAVAALLVYAMGADSRIDEVARRRGFHG